MPVSHNSHYSPYPDHSNNIKCTHVHSVCVPKLPVLSLKIQVCNRSNMLTQQELSCKDKGKAFFFLLVLNSANHLAG